MSRRDPLLFRIKENTYLRAFVYTSLVAGITTSLVLEYRLVNPYGTYVERAEDMDEQQKYPHLTALVQTFAVAFGVWLTTLCILQVLFDLGGSLVLF